MVRMKPLLITGFILTLAVILFFTFSQSEEKKIKKQFYMFSTLVSKDSDEDSFTLLKKAKQIGSLFNDPCELRLSEPPLSGSYSREEIISYTIRARAHFLQFTLKFYDFNVILPQEGIAQVVLTSRLIGKSISGEGIDEVRELECQLEKIEKKWLFKQIEVVEVLKK